MLSSLVECLQEGHSSILRSSRHIWECERHFVYIQMVRLGLSTKHQSELNKPTIYLIAPPSQKSLRLRHFWLPTPILKCAILLHPSVHLVSSSIWAQRRPRLRFGRHLVYNLLNYVKNCHSKHILHLLLHQCYSFWSCFQKAPRLHQSFPIHHGMNSQAWL